MDRGADLKSRRPQRRAGGRSHKDIPGVGGARGRPAGRPAGPPALGKWAGDDGRLREKCRRSPAGGNGEALCGRVVAQALPRSAAEPPRGDTPPFGRPRLAPCVRPCRTSELGQSGEEKAVRVWPGRRQATAPSRSLPAGRWERRLAEASPRFPSSRSAQVQPLPCTEASPPMPARATPRHRPTLRHRRRIARRGAPRRPPRHTCRPAGLAASKAPWAPFIRRKRLSMGPADPHASRGLTPLRGRAAPGRAGPGRAGPATVP